MQSDGDDDVARTE